MYAVQHLLVCWLEACEFRLRRDQHKKDHDVVRLWKDNEPLVLKRLLTLGGGERRYRLHHHRTALNSIHDDGLGVGRGSYAVGPLQMLYQFRGDVIDAELLAVSSRGANQRAIASTPLGVIPASGAIVT